MVIITSPNVFKGPDSMKRFFDPECSPPLPLVEIPECLNPLRKDGVRIYAKMMTSLPCQNVKNLPALNMLQKAGPNAHKTIVEPSSGSTVVSMSLIARVLYNNREVHAYVSNKTEQSRLRTLQFFGLKPVLYGGPAQPEISDPRGEINKIKQRSLMSENVWNPGQYENMDNPESHIRWTGPQLMMQLPEINIFCAGMGSAGCITGTGTYLKQHKPSVTIVGVCNKMNDAIPGPRPQALFDKIVFPWKAVTDVVQDISSAEAYRLSMLLSREGLICGPSSGMALKGLLEYLDEEKEHGTLMRHADFETGEVSCVFLCCDLPYQYLDTYFQKLNPEDFHLVENNQLSKIDQGSYNPSWELPAVKALQVAGLDYFTVVGQAVNQLSSYLSSMTTTIIDLRATVDFVDGHISGSLNMALEGLSTDSISPFDDVSVLEAQANSLEDLTISLLSSDQLIGTDSVMLVCYSGETSRLACSIMRKHGFEAYSLKGGFKSAVGV